MIKREFKKTPTKRLKQLVKKCLKARADDTDTWGCLAKNGMLFRIATLSHTKIPISVIKELEDKGKIVLKDDGYYKWIK